VTCSEIFAALYVFKGEVGEVTSDVLKTLLYVFGALQFFGGLFALANPSDWLSVVSPNSKLDAHTAFANTAAGGLTASLGLAMIYASASGVSRERRITAWAFVLGEMVNIANLVFRPLEGVHDTRFIAFSTVTVVLFTVALLVWQKDPHPKPARTTRGTNAVLRAALMVVFASTMLNVVAHYIPTNAYLDFVFPELQGNYSHAGTYRFGMLGATGFSLASLAIYASRQGEPQEQRRIAQIHIFSTAAWLLNEYLHAIDGHVSILRTFAVAVQLLLLLIGLYGVKDDAAKEEKESSAEEEAEVVEEEGDGEEEKVAKSTPKSTPKGTPKKTPKKAKEEEKASKPTTPRGGRRKSVGSTAKTPKK
jgi:hypothetical protein